MEHRFLESAYDSNTFGMTRRAFLRMASVAGVSAAGGMLVFPDQKAYGAFTPAPENPRWPTLSDERVRFSVHSDTHVGAGAENNYRDKIPASFSSLYSIASRLDAHFLIGDSADRGHPDEYTELAELLNASVRKPLGVVMGNHEYYNWRGDKDKAQNEFKSFLSSKLNVAGSFQIPGGAHEGQTDCDFIIGGDGTPGSGYHILAVSAHPGGYDNSYYGDRQDWIREHIAAAVAENPDKPVFLCTHHPFGNTVWYSTGGSWNGQFGLDPSERSGNDMAFYQELAAQYHQIIHFSGHTHIPLADPRSIYQDDGFTLIQTATFANNFWMSGDGSDEDGDTGGHPQSGQDANQCELIEVDPATHEVAIYRLDFRNGAPVGEPWVIIPSAGAAGFRYTHSDMASRSRPPLVTEGASITIPDDSITANGASFSITADKVTPDTTGLSDDVVIAYRIEIVDIASQNTKIYDVRFMSDYYKATANQPSIFTRPLFGAALADDSDYTVRAFAINAFDKETLIGEETFHTAAKIVPVMREPLLAIDFSTGDHADTSATSHEATLTGALSYETEAAFGVSVAVFDGAAAVGYDFDAQDYASIAEAETIEVLFKFSEVPTGSHCFDLFSSAQTGGQDLSYYGPLDSTSDNPLHKNPLLHHYMNAGSGYRSTNAVVMPDTWNHIIVTFDGEFMKYYLNGALVSQLTNTGSIPAPTAHPTRWYVGADTDSQGGAEAQMKGRVAFARLMPGVASAPQVEELYVASAPVAGPVAPPSAEAIGTATVGIAYTIPTLLARDANGVELQAIPSVSGPEGQTIELSKRPAAQSASITSTSETGVAYSFTPTEETTYTVTYRAGYAQRPSFSLRALAAAANPDPDPQPQPDPDQQRSGDSGGGADAAGDMSPSHLKTTQADSTTKPLLQTGDDTTIGGILVGAAATAGAAVCVARSFLKGEFNSGNEDLRP